MSSSPLVERPPHERYSPRHDAAPPRACANCAAPLTGQFCAECGQRDLPPDPSLRELVGEAWDAFVSIDGKVVSAIRLLLARPGALTIEYLQGRRVRYLTPLRLYLVCSVLYFLVAATVPDRSPKRDITLTTPQGKESVFGDSTGAGLPARDSLRLAASRDSSRRVALAAAGRIVPAGPLDAPTVAIADSLRLERKLARELGANPGWVKRQLVTRLVRNGQRVADDRKDFGHQIAERVPRMMFVLMPVFAALLALAYRPRRRRYPVHLIVSLHLHAFAFAALTVGLLIGTLPRSPLRSAGKVAMLVWITAYLVLALRRVYGGRLAATALRAAALLAIYATVSITMVGIMALGLILMY